MEADQIIFLGSAGGAVGSVAYYVATLFTNKRDGRLYGRLRTEREVESPGIEPTGAGVRGMIAKIGQSAAKPFMPKTREKQSSIKKQLAMAGIYAPAAIRAVT